jgi:ParB family chromosome partitioning protein
LARPDFRSQAAARLARERGEYTPALIDLLKPEDPTTVRDVRRMPIERVYSNPNQPRQRFDEDALQDLAASIREHGVLQPILVRPRADGHYQIVAGERRWRASRIAGLTEIPAIVEQIDDEAALEIAIIENLQREDISPLEEAEMFERMTSQHGYSLRKLATRLGKDKGYLENRLRLVDAPEDVRELVAVRRDTLSHAYELMKVEDARKRRRLAKQVAAGELSLVKLRQRIEGRPRPQLAAESEGEEAEAADGFAPFPPEAEATDALAPGREEAEAGDGFVPVPLEAEAADGFAPGREGAGSADAFAPVPPETTTDAAAYVAVPIEPEGPAIGAPGLDVASDHLSAALAELTDALVTDPALAEASGYERQQFAKYLTMAKIKLENAIAVVRQADRGLSHTLVSQLEDAMAAADAARSKSVETRE